MSYQFKGKVSFRLKANGKYNSRHKLYHKWLSMLQSCYDGMSKNYGKYGRVGIRVAARWHDFDNFVDDVSPVPEGMVLGRLRLGGDYGPDNFKWMDRVESARHSKAVTEWQKSIMLDNKMSA